MVYLSVDEIDKLIKEDVPYFDLTNHILGIKEEEGKISYFTREEAVVCGTEEVERIFKHLDIKCLDKISTGKKVNKGEVLISGTGKVENLHIAWKVGQNILDHCSGIATKTKKMVDICKDITPKVAILTTRKGFPGTKSLAIKSILAGGAYPHRLGLSETILIFKQHLNFIGGIDGLSKKLLDIKRDCCEKKIIVEAETIEDGLKLSKLGVDGIQLDKLKVEDLKRVVNLIKEDYPNIVLLAAGGVNEDNVLEYAKTGIDGIVTTSLYSAKPIDIGVKLEKM